MTKSLILKLNAHFRRTLTSNVTTRPLVRIKIITFIFLSLIATQGNKKVIKNSVSSQFMLSPNARRRTQNSSKNAILTQAKSMKSTFLAETPI